MKKNQDRLNHFGVFRSPTPNEKGYEAAMKFHKEQLEKNPDRKKELEKNYKKALSIHGTQSKSGIGFSQDEELRFFHAEFNYRTWEYGFGALPSSFNVLEGFFKWNPKLFYFELLEEEEHLFSLFDFFDFVTSKNCSGSLEYFIENVEDDLIYNYNIINDIKDLTFSTNDDIKYVIGGVSFVKRGNEVFMLLIAGEIGDTKEITKNLPNYDQSERNKPYLKTAEDRKREAVKLFGHNDIWKVNIYVRIDLESRTIDSRYIQKDQGNDFLTIADDYGMFEMSIKNKENLERLFAKQTEEIKAYDSVFEAAYNLLFLPEYFDFFDDDVLPEEHPTNLNGENLRKPRFRNQPTFDSKYFFKIKDVWVLDRNVDPLSGIIKLKQAELKIERGGYWQYIGPGKLGKDKNGNSIHSRTWVEKTLAWHESESEPPKVTVSVPTSISPNKGYIYLLRNASHELDLFKIGLTTKTVEERAKQLSGTPSPDKFLIINRWEVKDCVLAEKLIHEKLDDYRLNPRREFFKIPLEKAIEVIIPIIKDINENEL